jgi:hypothetical protein
MAANVSDKDVLQNLSEDPDTDVRMWVTCNTMTPELTLGKLAEDPVVFVRRGVAQNKSAPTPLLARLNKDTDLAVRALAFRNLNQVSLFRLRGWYKLTKNEVMRNLDPNLPARLFRH